MRKFDPLLALTDLCIQLNHQQLELLILVLFDGHWPDPFDFEMTKSNLFSRVNQSHPLSHD